MQSLKDRQSIRDYSDRALPTQTLSNLLWAAWGVNRPHSDGRTAPHWRNVYALEIYLTMADGVWRYEPNSHRIVFHMAGDLRPKRRPASLSLRRHRSIWFMRSICRS